MPDEMLRRSARRRAPAVLPSPVVPPRSRQSAPRATVDIERFSLDNGLRVVVSPDKTSPVVAVAVYYDVGMRSEPEGRTGFAHLFEHMMFQGSASLGKTEHFTYVQGSGGTLNGSTHLDYTNYYEVLPSNATELALFLEADRMRSIALTQENLDNQVAVVQNEIRVNVQNRPYGGFPWLSMPPILYDSFANSHDGYGSFVDLESATLDDARSFFDRYYAPGNAVLTVVGDVTTQQVQEWVEKHFGDIPARKTPKRRSFAEKAITSERRGVVRDRLAPAPNELQRLHDRQLLAHLRDLREQGRPVSAAGCHRCHRWGSASTRASARSGHCPTTRPPAAPRRGRRSPRFPSAARRCSD